MIDDHIVFVGDAVNRDSPKRKVFDLHGPPRCSVSQAAADYGRQHGIAVIAGGCPCMFGPTADFGHKAMRFFLTFSGNVPRDV
jgi:hypothetical protein